jgi:hypothetical protein
VGANSFDVKVEVRLRGVVTAGARPDDEHELDWEHLLHRRRCLLQDLFLLHVDLGGWVSRSAASRPEQALADPLAETVRRR